MDTGVHNLLVRPRGGWLNGHAPDVLHIGLLNNMPDAALESTERQFSRLLGAAASEIPIRWHLFSLRSIARSDTGSLHLIHQNYGTPRDLYNTPLNALIVTGTEPLQQDLRQETYWPELATMFDWIEREGPPAIFSCLAAHAAVMHFDGIERRRLPQKRFGLFDHVVAAEHLLTASLAAPLRIAHSRWNEVPADALNEAGYEILTYAPEAGADLFTKRKRNALLFLQGHPEYDSDTLAREYRRDVRRYLAGARDSYPNLPLHYFGQEEADALQRFRDRAVAGRDERLMDRFPAITSRRISATAPMSPVFGALLREINARRDSRYGMAPRRAVTTQAHAP
jgi:homoserine O-succinyltransferase/O-acetyltransferase